MIYTSKLIVLAKLNKVKYECRKDQDFENQKKRKYYDIFWKNQFLFMKFPPSSLGDLTDFFAHEKLTYHIKSWHLIQEQCHKISRNSIPEILSYYLSFLQMIVMIKMLLDNLAGFLVSGHILCTFTTNFSYFIDSSVLRYVPFRRSE